MSAQVSSSKSAPYNFSYVNRVPDPDRGVVCVLSSHLTEQLGVLHDVSLPYPVESPASSPYEVNEMGLLKGKGMFATRRLETGDLILDERAFMVIPVGADDETDMLRHVFSMLPEDDQRALLSLHNHQVDAKPEDVLSNIMQTNAYTLELTDTSDPQQKYAALFKDISRANHDCSPNVVRSWSSKTLSMQLRASRAIEAGDEITSYYVLPTWPSALRNAHLLERYGFTCHCVACTSPGSDATRAWIDFIDVPSMRDSGGLSSVVDKTLKVIELVEGEGLHGSPMYPVLLLQVATLLVALGDMRAVEYGKRMYTRKRAGNMEFAQYEKYAELVTYEDVMKLASQLKADSGRSR